MCFDYFYESVICHFQKPKYGDKEGTDFLCKINDRALFLWKPSLSVNVIIELLRAAKALGSSKIRDCYNQLKNSGAFDYMSDDDQKILEEAFKKCLGSQMGNDFPVAGLT